MNPLRALIVVAITLIARPAFAGITQSGGPGIGQLVVNPNNMKYTADPYNIDRVFYWPEQTSHTLANDLAVSILPPGSFPSDSTTHADDNTLLIPQGTLIDSYLLYYDPQSGTTVASFLFDDPIVGLITNSRDSSPADDHFMLSDFLINPLVPAVNIPAAHFDVRGTEPTSGDFIRWLSPNEIEIHLSAGDPGDQIRVITSPVPEPASLILVAPAIAALRRRAPRVAR